MPVASCPNSPSTGESGNLACWTSHHKDLGEVPPTQLQVIHQLLGRLPSSAPGLCPASAASRPGSDWGKGLGLGRVSWL